MLTIKDIAGEEVIDIIDPIAVNKDHDRLQYLQHAIKYRANHNNVPAIDQNIHSTVASDDDMTQKLFA